MVMLVPLMILALLSSWSADWLESATASNTSSTPVFSLRERPQKSAGEAASKLTEYVLMGISVGSRISGPGPRVLLYISKPYLPQKNRRRIEWLLHRGREQVLRR